MTGGDTMRDDNTTWLVLDALTAAVPLRIHELRQMSAGRREDTMRHWAAAAVDPTASSGDKLTRRGKRYPATSRHPEPSTADVFNTMAKGIAALACCPGGARMWDVLWCAEHHPYGARTPVCESCQRRELLTTVADRLTALTRMIGNRRRTDD